MHHLLLALLAIAAPASALISATTTSTPSCQPGYPCYSLCGISTLQPLHLQNSSFRCYNIPLTQRKLPSLLPITLKHIKVQALHLQPSSNCSPFKIKLYKDSFEGLQSVETLELSCIEISMEQGIFNKVSALFHDPALPGIDDEFFSHFPNLRSLQLHQLRIGKLQLENIRQHLRKVVSISLMKNNLTTIRAHAFINLPSLRHLHIGENKLVEVKQDMFHGLGRLATLEIVNNSISLIRNTTFKSLQQLETLVLRGNGIREIQDGAFGDLPGLVWLHLQHNQLEKFPAVDFRRFRNFGGMGLVGNRISALRRQDVEGFGRVRWSLGQNQLGWIEQQTFAGWTQAPLSFPGFQSVQENGKAVIVTGGVIKMAAAMVEMTRNGGRWYASLDI